MPRQARLSEQERRTRQAVRQSTRRSSLSQTPDLDGLARQRNARARDTDRQRVRRQILADATGADSSSRRQAQLQRARELQRLRRARLRNHSTDESASTDSSSFLPLHQREAIDAFFDRVVGVRADVGECQICLERYHGMHLRGLDCDRCHREVSFHSVFLFFSFNVFYSEVIIAMESQMMQTRV
jgi:hypothetical protein